MKIKDLPILQKFPKRFSQKECLKSYEIWYHPEYYKIIKNKEKFSYDKFIEKYNEEPAFGGIYVTSMVDSYFPHDTSLDKQIIITPLGKCYFDTRYSNLVAVPQHYLSSKSIKISNSIKISKKDLKSSSCEETPKRLLDLEKNGLNYSDWEGQTEHYLQIKDIIKLKKGDKLKFIILSNYVDDIKSNKLYKPKDYYKYCSRIYTHDKDLKGTIQRGPMESIKNKKKSIKKSLNNKRNKSNIINKKKSKKIIINKRMKRLLAPTDVEFIINIKDYKLHKYLKNKAPWGWGFWAALENGYLQINGKKKKWTTFPKNTPIGIRGPLILWDKLDKLPNIYNLYL